MKFPSILSARVLMPVVVAVVGLVAAESCQAQFRRYTPPSRPTMPSQLNYFRQDTGALDSYNAFIVPQRRLEQQLGNMVQQERNDRRQIQRQLDEITQIRNSTAAPTGTSATFMNYSHYYQRSRPAIR